MINEFLVSQTTKFEVVSSSKIWIISYLMENGNYKF
jgi:hypothetical protein